MSRLLSITLAERRDYTDSSRKSCDNYWSQYLLCHMNLPFVICHVCCQSPLPSAVITPIAPVRAAAITEVNTCFVIWTSPFVIRHGCCQSSLPSAVITPIAPVRAAAITEVNTCFVIRTSPFVICHGCCQSPLPSAVITPIAPVRAAAITEVNTCFVIWTSLSLYVTAVVNRPCRVLWLHR